MNNVNHHQTTDELTVEEIPNATSDDYEILGSFVDGGQQVIVVRKREENHIFY